MKLITAVLWLVFVSSSAPSHAHEGHDHLPVSLKKALELGLSAVEGYTSTTPPFNSEILDESWRDLPQSAATIYENGRGYYIVKVTNERAGKSLYLRILLDGRIDNVNYSGDFPATTE